MKLHFHGVFLCMYLRQQYKQEKTESNNQDYAIKCVNKNIMGNLRETAKYVFKILNYFIP